MARRGETLHRKIKTVRSLLEILSAELQKIVLCFEVILFRLLLFGLSIYGAAVATGILHR